MTKSMLLAAFASIAFSGMAFAKDDLTTKSGVLHSVDFSAYTLTIANEKGEMETFNFTPDTRTIVDGRSISLRRALKPGYEVEIKLRPSKLAQASL